MSMTLAFGLDAGSTTIKLVALTEDKSISWHHSEATSARLTSQLDRLIQTAREECHADESTPLVATGYGRHLVPDACKVITEIHCHAKGVFASLAHGGTLIDIGGQDTKVIVLDACGKVQDFAMNDKCAAGTGRFLQVMANTLGMEVSELAEQEVPGEKVTVNSMCTVFAESEIIGLLARGMSKGGIIAGLHQSVGKRVAAMARRLGVKEQVAFTGGVALNKGVERALVEELGCPVVVLEDCQFTGALGAALLALK